MKRLFSLLGVLVLFLGFMVLPAFAAESFVIDGSGMNGQYPFLIPNGDYMVYAAFDSSGGISLRGSTRTPVAVRYELVTESYGATYEFARVSLLLYDSSGSSMPLDLALFYYDNAMQVLVVNPETSKTQPFVADSGSTMSLTFVPFENAAPTLSGVVDSDMIGGVLEQVTSLLPVVLVVIIGYIAIRKGIAFLRAVLAGA